MKRDNSLDLTSTIQLFEKFVGRLRAKNISFDSDLAIEAAERLRQISFLLEKILLIKCRIESGAKLEVSEFGFRFEPKAVVSHAGTDETGAAINEAFFLVRLLTESFYYMAHRLMKILTTRNKITNTLAVPYLGSFDAAGVRNVRNHLIEHPEGKGSQVFCQNNSFGGGDGPQLKVDREPGSSANHPDPGLFANAREFKRNLERRLLHALDNEMK